MTRSKKLTLTALCAALCIVLPLCFHLIPNGGSLFSPMHIPVLLCGLCCGPLWGLMCGIVGPLLSSLLTGMPNAAYLPPMLVELAVYGIISGVMMKAVRTGRFYADLYISLASAMLIGRIAAGLFMGLIFTDGYSIALWAAGYFLGSMPGIIAHLILVPALYAALVRAGAPGERQGRKNGRNEHEKN